MKMNLVLPLILAATFFSFNSSATSLPVPTGPHIEPGPIFEITEGHQVIRALLQNPELVKTLNDEYVTEVTKVTTQGIRPGHQRYILEVRSCGNCLPKTGRVVIDADETPTYVDAPIDYNIQITIQKGHY